MRLLLITLLVLLSNDPREIARANLLKKEAEQAFLSGDYKLAIDNYNFLLDSLQVNDDLVRLNLAHAYYHIRDSANAKSAYGTVGTSSNKKLKSIAYQQLGVMSKEANKLKLALEQLKSSIKADPTNKEAIYNYEVVKKLLEDKKKQQNQDKDNENNNKDNKDNEKKDQDQQNQDQQNKDGEKENKDQKGEKKDQPDQESKEQQQQQDQQEGDQGEQQEKQQEKSQEQMTREKLKEMGISEEKALQLLEAMRQSEIKYLQNQKRKATKRPPSGKPDW